MKTLSRVWPGILVFLLASSAFAFQPLRSSTGAAIHWAGNPTYKINKNGSNNPTTNGCVANEFTTINNSFSHWAALPNMTLNVQYGGTTSRTDWCGQGGMTGCDAFNLVLFTTGFSSNAILAMTVNYYTVSTGVIAGTDMAINDAIDWSDDPLSKPSCSGGGFYSLEAVITHEAGHFYGLDHSFCTDVGASFTPAIAATMYPFYFDNDYWTDMVSLAQDDMAGVVSLYHNSNPTGWGKIKGRVQYNNGVGLFGVQVTAIRASDKVPIVTTFTRNGNYTLYGLPPDDYYVYVNTPRIGSQLFTASVSKYWRGPDQVPYILLYKQLKVNQRSSLGPGGTPFTKTAAKIITVTADTTHKGVNFTYPSP